MREVVGSADGVETVVDDDGILVHCRPGQTVINLSTVAASSTIRLNELLNERDVQYIGAVISGGRRGDRKRVAGFRADRREGAEHRLKRHGPHRETAQHFSQRRVSLAATAEVMVARMSAGIDPRRLLDVLNSSGVDFAVQNRFRKIVDGDYAEGDLTAKPVTKEVVQHIQVFAN